MPLSTIQAAGDIPSVDDIVPLSEDDQPVLNEIWKVLIKYGANNRFGIWLLHNHPGQMPLRVRFFLRG